MGVIAFISPKGGAGKTTAALALALSLVEDGDRVAMIDSDPNKPLLRWSGLPGRPEGVTVHAAPTQADIVVAQREARRRDPDWIILDTEGSIRGSMAFVAIRPDLVVTPLAGSQLEAVEAIKAAEMVRTSGRRGGRPTPHRCLLTRVPAALQPRSIKGVVAQLREREIELLPVALLEKEAFRSLFAVGGGFDGLVSEGVGGASVARENAHAFKTAVLDVITQRPGSAACDRAS